MAIAHRGSNSNSGTASTATTGTHGISISDGDLVVVYVNANDANTIAIDSDAGATWETEVFDETPSGETANHAMYWKEANGSEPTAYTASLGSSRAYAMTVQVFSGGGTGWEIDSAVNTVKVVTQTTYLLFEAVNGATVSDNSVSVVAGGQDRTGSTSGVADNSYIGEVFETAGRHTGAAYRLFSTGSTLSFDITWDDDNGDIDYTYDAHISFIESAASGTNPKGPLGHVFRGPFGGPI
jgi:hypothetical protein